MFTSNFFDELKCTQIFINIDQISKKNQLSDKKSLTPDKLTIKSGSHMYCKSNNSQTFLVNISSNIIHGWYSDKLIEVDEISPLDLFHDASLRSSFTQILMNEIYLVE